MRKNVYSDKKIYRGAEKEENRDTNMQSDLSNKSERVKESLDAGERYPKKIDACLSRLK